MQQGCPFIGVGTEFCRCRQAGSGISRRQRKLCRRRAHPQARRPPSSLRSGHQRSLTCGFQKMDEKKCPLNGTSLGPSRHGPVPVSAPPISAGCPHMRLRMCRTCRWVCWGRRLPPDPQCRSSGTESERHRPTGPYAQLGRDHVDGVKETCVVHGPQ